MEVSNISTRKNYDYLNFMTINKHNNDKPIKIWHRLFDDMS